MDLNGAMSNSSTYPSMSDLMARVGVLLLQWGFLENAIRGDKHERKGQDDLAELDDVRRIRNLVAHSMSRACADSEKAEEPFVSCLQQDGTERRISYSELGSAVATLEKLRLSRF